MEIKVNGEPMSIDQQLPVTQLLDRLGYQDRFVAVAINQRCIPRSSYAEQHIQAGDQIEILAPMAGG